MTSPVETETALYFQHIAAKVAAAAAASHSVQDAVSSEAHTSAAAAAASMTTSTTAAAVAAVAAAASAAAAAAAAAAATAAAAAGTTSDTESVATVLQSVPTLMQTSSALLTQVEQLKQAAPLPIDLGPSGSVACTATGVRYGTNSESGGGSNDLSAQRAQATLFIERVRFLRSLPKNISPVDARAYPSLLPPQSDEMRGRKTLVLDVDETLVHSSYDATVRHDMHLRVDVAAGASLDVYVAVRPYVQAFLDMIASRFEVVVFTASVGLYCNPLMDLLDCHHRLGHLRLCREHCSVVSSTFVKDLSLLGRDLDQVVIIDNSPVTYLFQQRNALPVTSWFDDRNDTELLRLMPVLEALAAADNVYDVLDNYNALMQLQQLQQHNM